MTDLTNVSELARETAIELLAALDAFPVGHPEEFPTMELCIQSALSKLAAEKDVEITRLKNVVREEWDSVAADKILADHDKLTADLARHVAALNEVVTALERWFAAKHPHPNDVGTALEVARTALQRIDKELP